MTTNRKSNPLIGTIVLIIAIVTYNMPVAANRVKQQMKQKIDAVKEKPHIVFLITKDSLNYEAHKTIPEFAEMLKKKYGYKVTVLLGKGDHGSYRYTGLEVLSQADLLVVFARRIALPHEQMNAIKNYLLKGKPLIGIRTANHAFTMRGKIADGFEDWPAFVADILGCENRGYGPVEPGMDVSVVAEMASHPIVKDLQIQHWHSKGSIYLVAPLMDKEASILLEGKINDITEPIAWTRSAGKSKIFYTSLGYPADFKTPSFITLLVSGIKWALVSPE